MAYQRSVWDGLSDLASAKIRRHASGRILKVNDKCDTFCKKHGDNAAYPEVIKALCQDHLNTVGDSPVSMFLRFFDVTELNELLKGQKFDQNFLIPVTDEDITHVLRQTVLDDTNAVLIHQMLILRLDTNDDAVKLIIFLLDDVDDVAAHLCTYHMQARSKTNISTVLHFFKASANGLELHVNPHINAAGKIRVLVIPNIAVQHNETESPCSVVQPEQSNNTSDNNPSSFVSDARAASSPQMPSAHSTDGAPPPSLDVPSTTQATSPPVSSPLPDNSPIRKSISKHHINVNGGQEWGQQCHMMLSTHLAPSSFCAYYAGMGDCARELIQLIQRNMHNALYKSTTDVIEVITENSATIAYDMPLILAEPRAQGSAHLGHLLVVARVVFKCDPVDVVAFINGVMEGCGAMQDGGEHASIPRHDDDGDNPDDDHHDHKHNQRDRMKRDAPMPNTGAVDQDCASVGHHAKSPKLSETLEKWRNFHSELMSDKSQPCKAEVVAEPYAIIDEKPIPLIYKPLVMQTVTAAHVTADLPPFYDLSKMSISSNKEPVIRPMPINILDKGMSVLKLIDFTEKYLRRFTADCARIDRDPYDRIDCNLSMDQLKSLYDVLFNRSLVVVCPDVQVPVPGYFFTQKVAKIMDNVGYRLEIRNLEGVLMKLDNSDAYARITVMQDIDITKVINRLTSIVHSFFDDTAVINAGNAPVLSAYEAVVIQMLDSHELPVKHRPSSSSSTTRSMPSTVPASLSTTRSTSPSQLRAQTSILQPQKQLCFAHYTHPDVMPQDVIDEINRQDLLPMGYECVLEHSMTTGANAYKMGVSFRKIDPESSFTENDCILQWSPGRDVKYITLLMNSKAVRVQLLPRSKK